MSTTRRSGRSRSKSRSKRDGEGSGSESEPPQAPSPAELPSEEEEFAESQQAGARVLERAEELEKIKKQQRETGDSRGGAYTSQRAMADEPASKRQCIDQATANVLLLLSVMSPTELPSSVDAREVAEELEAIWSLHGVTAPDAGPGLDARIREHCDGLRARLRELRSV